jgi:hypothetical protein
VWMLHCCDEFARKEDMLVEINAGLGMRVLNGNDNYNHTTNGSREGAKTRRHDNNLTGAGSPVGCLRALTGGQCFGSMVFK